MLNHKHFLIRVTSTQFQNHVFSLVSSVVSLHAVSFGFIAQCLGQDICLWNVSNTEFYAHSIEIVAHCLSHYKTNDWN